MKHFCQICGKPTMYTLTPPKYCSQCGDDFSVTTKQKDKSVHDQALEKAKDKYEVNTPKFVPVTKAAPKNYPNPARASFKLINDDDDVETNDDDTYGSLDGDQEFNPELFSTIKPKFKIQSFGSNSQSFESLLTQGHASNYRPATAEEIRDLRGQGEQVNTNPSSVLEEFKREAGSLRAQQD